MAQGGQRGPTALSLVFRLVLLMALIVVVAVAAIADAGRTAAGTVVSAAAGITTAAGTTTTAAGTTTAAAGTTVAATQAAAAEVAVAIIEVRPLQGGDRGGCRGLAQAVCDEEDLLALARARHATGEDSYSLSRVEADRFWNLRAISRARDRGHEADDLAVGRVNRVQILSRAFRTSRARRQRRTDAHQRFGGLYDCGGRNRRREGKPDAEQAGSNVRRFHHVYSTTVRTGRPRGARWNMVFGKSLHGDFLVELTVR